MQNDSLTVPHVTALLIRSGLGVVFIWASWEKILHPAAFAEIILNYQILPAALAPTVAIVLPWIECLCGLLLVSGRAVPGSILAVNCMLLVFLLITGFNLYRGLDISCGCFSVSPDSGREGAWSLVRNSLLLTAGIWLFGFTVSRPGPGHLDTGGKAGYRAG